jgi:hypothetical protein
MLDFCRGKGSGENVSYHVIGRAVDEPNRVFFDDPTDEGKTYVDVLGPSMILVILSECDG